MPITVNAEAKMRDYAYNALPEELQSLVFSSKTNSGAFCLSGAGQSPSTILCIATILNHTSPGGAHTKRELGNYLRNHKEACNDATAMAELSNQERASSESDANGCQHATPFEYLGGMMRIVHKAGVSDDEFTFIMANEDGYTLWISNLVRCGRL